VPALSTIVQKGNIVEWISVKDRLPDFLEDKDYSENVLGICNGKLGIFNRFWVNGEGWLWAKAYYVYGGLEEADCESDDDYDVNHWMPLPQPPKE
jgi:hypothetical protein